MNEVNKKMISTLLEWGDIVCNDDCKNCILNKDVDCTSEFTTDYCTMLNHLAKALARDMDKEDNTVREIYCEEHFFSLELLIEFINNHNIKVISIFPNVYNKAYREYILIYSYMEKK